MCDELSNKDSKGFKSQSKLFSNSNDICVQLQEKVYKKRKHYNEQS